MTKQEIKRKAMTLGFEAQYSGEEGIWYFNPLMRKILQNRIEKLRNQEESNSRNVKIAISEHLLKQWPIQISTEIYDEMDLNMLES